MKLSFQTILIGIFIIAFVGAILIFSGVIKVGSSSSGTTPVGSVSVWGVYPQSIVQPYIEQLNVQNKTMTISYSEKVPDTFRTKLIEAIAEGTAPDLVIADANELLSFRDKLYTIPFTTYTERLYRDSFVDGASIFLSKEGVMASPLLIDPLVVFYNKDILAGQNYVVPPTTWQGVVSALPQFLKRDAKGTITQTAIGLGEWSNVVHFKDILSALFLQTGNPIVSLNAAGTYQDRLSTAPEGTKEPPVVSALDFYTGFANQVSDRFSWTRTLPSTLDMFLAGKSAFYIGRGSELFTIQSRNPNLNFDVTSLFQTDGAVRPITYGAFSGIGLVKTSPNFTASYSALGMLTSKEFVQYLSGVLALPPARRDVLLTNQQNPYVQVYFQAALSAFTWPDINESATEGIFRDMIRTVNSGASNPTQAIYEASHNLQSSLR